MRVLNLVETFRQDSREPEHFLTTVANLKDSGGMCGAIGDEYDAVVC